MAKDINKRTFDDATKLKLEIFREYFREWLPVFIHQPYFERIFIYDFFSGSGKDKDGNYGSPLILLKEAMGDNQMFCSNVAQNKIAFGFNEKITTKATELKQNIEGHLKECLKNCNRKECVYQVGYGNYDFKDAFDSENVKSILENPKYDKLILLDQYGFKEVGNNVFLNLTQYPKTDFIFFISSSFIRRFKEHEYIKKYFDTNNILFDEAAPNHCHKQIAEYYKSLIPKDKEYYLHQFTIKKGSNYYGLIFGTAHSLGMEKFLKVCWRHDKYAGESNCNINNDYELGTLFYTEENTNKINDYKKELEDLILKGKINTNQIGLKHALKSGVLPNAFIEVTENLVKQKKIEIIGKFNKKKTNIHRLTEKDIYQIKTI